MVKKTKENSIDPHAEDYRRPMEVTDIVCYSQEAFAVCPRCKIALEREFQSYCDRCGQALNWKRFKFR